MAPLAFTTDRPSTLAAKVVEYMTANNNWLTAHLGGVHHEIAVVCTPEQQAAVQRAIDRFNGRTANDVYFVGKYFTREFAERSLELTRFWDCTPLCPHEQIRRDACGCEPRAAQMCAHAEELVNTCDCDFLDNWAHNHLPPVADADVRDFFVNRPLFVGVESAAINERLVQETFLLGDAVWCSPTSGQVLLALVYG